MIKKILQLYLQKDCIQTSYSPGFPFFVGDLQSSAWIAARKGERDLIWRVLNKERLSCKPLLSIGEDAPANYHGWTRCCWQDNNSVQVKSRRDCNHYSYYRFVLHVVSSEPRAGERLGADVLGHIGYQCTGRTPLRVGAAQQGAWPLFSREAADAWHSWVPADALPHVLDPAEGFVVAKREQKITTVCRVRFKATYAASVTKYTTSTDCDEWEAKCNAVCRWDSEVNGIRPSLKLLTLSSLSASVKSDGSTFQNSYLNKNITL